VGMIYISKWLAHAINNIINTNFSYFCVWG
jgi:hypothetical protein